MILQHINKITI